MQRTRQNGQAMVEMAVILGVVVMLLLGIIYLGKFHDIQATTIQAARYAAWERTVHSNAGMSDTQVQSQTRARLFTWNKDALKSTDGLANGAGWSTQTAVWSDHAGSGRLIAQPGDVSVGTVTGPLSGVASNALGEAMSGMSGFLAAITGGEPLPTGGTVTGNISVKLNNIAVLPAPLDALNLTLRESASVMVDSWDASGPRQAALRTRTFTAAGPLAQVDSLLGPIKVGLGLIEPAFNDFHFGQVCPDIVPSDRVESASVLPAYKGGGACVR